MHAPFDTVCFAVRLATWCLVGLLVVPQARAQFSITPTDSLVTSAPADSILTIMQIDVVNEAADSVAFTWRLIQEVVPEGWDVNLCDLGECYDGIPNSATMIPAATDAHAYLKLLVNPLAIVGDGFWHFWVYPEGDEDAKRDLYFRMSTYAVGVGELALENPILWAPNPSFGTLHLTGEFFPQTRVQLFDAAGRLLGTQRPTSGTLNLTMYPSKAPQILTLVTLQNSSSLPGDRRHVQRILLLPSE